VGAGDTIVDFQNGDRIDLSAIDANSGAGGNQQFTFIGSGAFSGAGQVRAEYDAGTKQWTVSGDVDGDGEADFEILVARVDSSPIVMTDFIL
jgi:hypothetical protein